MAQPLLDFLTGRARAFLPFLRTAAAAGVKATAVIDVLRAFGIPFTTQRVLDIYAALLGTKDVSRYLRIVPPNVPLPEEAHTFQIFRLKANYVYVVQVEHPELETPRFATVKSDIPLSKNQILANATAIFTSSETTRIDVKNFDDAEISILEAYRLTGAP